MAHYKICIVGAGMIGSAAARHCGLLKNGTETILIGPEEPDKQDYGQHEVFGAHYDQARITRHLDTDPLWCQLAAESIKRYRSIESQSGINFFLESGYLCLFHSADEDLKLVRDVAKSQSVNYRFLTDVDAIKHRFPYLNPTSGTVGMYEPSKSGSINPRRLVKAQQLLAVEHGVTVLKDVVVKIERGISSGFHISTKNNGFVTADKIILCVGAFLESFQLLPRRLQIQVNPKLISQARFPVDHSFLESFEGMPSISMISNGTDNFYMVPPVKYPDGKWYLKIGLHTDHSIANPTNPRDIRDWYLNGSEGLSHNDMKTKIIRIVGNFLPGIRGLKWGPRDIVFDTCAITETSNVRPYVDQISENFYIVTGCNGYAAKSSDELGRLVAKLSITGLWDCPVSAENFKCQFKRDFSKL